MADRTRLRGQYTEYRPEFNAWWQRWKAWNARPQPEEGSPEDKADQAEGELLVQQKEQLEAWFRRIQVLALKLGLDPRNPHNPTAEERVERFRSNLKTGRYARTPRMVSLLDIRQRRIDCQRPAQARTTPQQRRRAPTRRTTSRAGARTSSSSDDPSDPDPALGRSPEHQLARDGGFVHVGELVAAELARLRALDRGAA